MPRTTRRPTALNATGANATGLDPTGLDPTALSPTARAQLAALADVGSALEPEGLDHWLFGGWAVDLWCGRVTREHHDIDLAVPLDDRAAVHDVLVSRGWVHSPEADEDVGTRYRREGVLLELTFVVRDGERVLLPFEPEPVVWSPTPLGDVRRTLYGTEARVVPIEVMRRDKSHPRDDPDDAAKDRADHAALARIAGA